jgi:hypothetical protein
MSDIPTLRAKFVGGPRDKKTRSLPSPKAPMVIECPEDCKFHNVRGRYGFYALVFAIGFVAVLGVIHIIDGACHGKRRSKSARG